VIRNTPTITVVEVRNGQRAMTCFTTPSTGCSPGPPRPLRPVPPSPGRPGR
jgi:hypothetical protein